MNSHAHEAWAWHPTTSRRLTAHCEKPLYKQFSKPARMVMQLAEQEALRWKYDYIGTEHILLGLVNAESGVVRSILTDLKVGPRQICGEVAKIIQPGVIPFRFANLPLTPRGRNVVNNAIKEARRLRHDYVGTAHLLLGLRQEEEGVGAQILINFGVGLNDLHAATEKLVDRE